MSLSLQSAADEPKARRYRTPFHAEGSSGFSRVRRGGGRRSDVTWIAEGERSVNAPQS
jgi:hypothetical protein